jgi:hypothetical protein
VAWEIVDGELNVDADLPEGIRAELILPGSEPESVAGGQSVRRSIAAEVRSPA